MVFLTMTPSIVEGLGTLGESAPPASSESKPAETPTEPSLESPALGKPISHSQILDLWRELREQKKTEYTLEKLLHGASVYIPPPPPKPEPVSPQHLPPPSSLYHAANVPLQTPEYKALMARLRREEEARAYERMLNPPNLPAPPFDPYAAVHKPSNPVDADTEDAVAAVAKELNQQLMVVLNVLLTVFGTAAAVWWAARWWSPAARVLLSLGAAILVAIADVVIFWVFAWRVDGGRKREGERQEVREVVNTWVVGGEGTGGKAEVETKVIGEGEDETTTSLRRRNRPPS